MGWDDNTQEVDHHDLAEPQQGGGKKKDLSIFPADMHDHQSLLEKSQPPPQLPPVRITYQTPPTSTLMAVLGPPEPKLPPPLLQRAKALLIN